MEGCYRLYQLLIVIAFNVDVCLYHGSRAAGTLVRVCDHPGTDLATIQRPEGTGFRTIT
jgi:hypothetical protein